MKHYYRRIKCAHEGCNKTKTVTFTTKREYFSYKVKEWFCVYHSHPEEVLSESNNETIQELICVEKDGNKYWQKAEDYGTNKVDSGYQFGNGYRARASNFEVDTKLIVTAKIISNN